jgi:hypothetical protein
MERFRLLTIITPLYHQKGVSKQQAPTGQQQQQGGAYNKCSLDLTRKDLLLRDQTLKFIQNISIFIKYLNNQDLGKLDGELREIIMAFQSLIEVIQCIDLDKSSTISGQLADLEACLGLMINEFKASQIEKVVSLALDLARKANEMFINITKCGSC